MMTEPLPTLIFDFDGTLANTFDLVVQAVNQCSKDYGYEPLSATQLDYLRGLPAHKVIHVLGVPWYKLPELILKVKRYMKSHMGEISLYPDIAPVIESLKARGFLLGIITSNSRENVELLLKKNQCDAFSFINSTPHLFGKAKTLKKVIKQWELDKKNVYYIGDETRDIDAARLCGVQSIAVTWGFNKKELLESSKPDYLVSDAQELNRIFCPMERLPSPFGKRCPKGG